MKSETLEEARIAIIGHAVQSFNRDYYASKFLPLDVDVTPVVPAHRDVLDDAPNYTLSELNLKTLGDGFGADIYQHLLNVLAYYAVILSSLTLLEGDHKAFDGRFKENGRKAGTGQGINSKWYSSSGFVLSKCVPYVRSIRRESKHENKKSKSENAGGEMKNEVHDQKREVLQNKAEEAEKDWSNGELHLEDKLVLAMEELISTDWATLNSGTKSLKLATARQCIKICYEMLERLKAQENGVHNVTINIDGSVTKAIELQDIIVTLLNHLKCRASEFNGNEDWLIAWIASIIQVPLEIGDMKSVVGVVMVSPGCFVMPSLLLVGFFLVVKTVSGVDTVLSSPENRSLLIGAGYQEGKRSPGGLGAGTRQTWRLFQVMKFPRLTTGMKITIAAFNIEDKVFSAGEY